MEGLLYRKSSGLLAVSVVMVLFSAACGTTYLANTEIPDTPDNREIYQRVMDYREAIEKRDSEALAAMTSRTYFENAGTTDRSDDDYGFDALQGTLLDELRDNILAVQLRILMHRIAIDGDRAYADYEYYYTFKYVEGGVEGWEPKNDFNRLEFVREDGIWKIASGM
jgi:hypothetical protein